MGRISDIIPPIYYDKQNDLIRFVDCLDVEVKELERKIKGITDLVNIDKCPDDKLPYLAALTNCPLMGNDPVLWRKQIRNWPYILKIKGTALSLDVFLNTIDVDEHVLYTFFRDAEGNLVEEKPEGEPFQDDTGLWRNIRTHYFDLDIIYNNEHYQTWKEWHDDFLRSMNFWLTRAKPFHAELRNLRVILKRETKQLLFVGTADILGIHHDIDFVRGSKSEIEQKIFAGAVPVQGIHHGVAFIQHTHSETETDILAGVIPVQGLYHSLDFAQHFHSESQSSIVYGVADLQNIHHELSIYQHSPETSTLAFSSAGIVSCGIHTQISMAA